MRKKIIGFVVCTLLITTILPMTILAGDPGNPEIIRGWYMSATKPNNNPPVFGAPFPLNNSTGNVLSLSWSISIIDPEGDAFSWTIKCNNGKTSSATGATNGTKSLLLIGLAYSTTYKVWVNATDPMGSGNYTRKWYVFTTQTNPANNPPVFGTPSPMNSSTENTLSLTWSIPISDPEGNTFSWTIQCSNTQKNNGTAATNGTKSLILTGLTNLTTYKIWVNATDPIGSGVYTRKWYTFTTQGPRPPNKPSQPFGQVNGTITKEYSYTTSTTDPNGDKVYYQWDWGDGTTSEWLGPFNSGATCQANHTWDTKGTYNIKVKAKDVYGGESSWSDPLPVTMPCSYRPIPYLSELLFHRFLNAFPLLRQLMGYYESSLFFLFFAFDSHKNY